MYEEGRFMSGSEPSLAQQPKSHQCISLHFRKLLGLQASSVLLDFLVVVTGKIAVDALLVLPNCVGDEFSGSVNGFEKFLRATALLLDHQRRTFFFPETLGFRNIRSTDFHKNKAND